MSDPDDPTHDALITATIPYVRRLALQIARDLPSGVGLDDLIAAGQDGLLDASRRFDATRGVRFTTYAHYRIRGAILDHVRTAAGQSVVWRARVAAEAAVDDVIESRVADAPAPTSAIEAAGLLESVLDEVSTAYVLSELAVHVTPEAPEDPEAQLRDRQHEREVSEAIDALPQRERDMIRAVYYEGMSIEAAGDAQKISKGWASRVHARGLALLRARLAEKP